MKITVIDLIRIGDNIINSIGKHRLINDQVLNNKVKAYQKIKRGLDDLSVSDADNLKKLSCCIREIEKQLDIISPD